MINLAVATFLTCGNIVLEGFSTPPTSVEEIVIYRAKVTCRKEYNSCPMSIIKTKNDSYLVTCGG